MHSRAKCTNGLRTGDLYLWIARPGKNAHAAAHIGILSVEERQRARRLHRPADHEQFILAHALVRLALSWHFGIPPGEWRFGRNGTGRPFVMTPLIWPMVQFSLSHTHGLAACLITLAPLAAVDVEKVVYDEQLILAAGEVLSGAEQKALSAISRQEWTRRFFDHWTLKEAYSKARGMGLRLPLTDMGFDFAPGGKIQARFAAGLNDDPSAWLFWSARLSWEHAISIAAKKDAGERFEVSLKYVKLQGLRMVFEEPLHDKSPIDLSESFEQRLS